MRHRQHRHVRIIVVRPHEQRQRPEVRRCPHEDQREHQPRLNREAARCNDPADHRRECPCSAANHDVLRRRTLQPHRVDHGVKEDGEQQHACRQQIGAQRQHHHRQTRQRHTQGQRLTGLHFARRNGPLCGALHHRVDVRIPPHVQRTRGPCPDGHKQDGGKAHNRMHRRRCRQHANHRGENHKLHHTWLQKSEVIAQLRFMFCSGCVGDVGHPAPLCWEGAKPPPWLSWTQPARSEARQRILQPLCRATPHRPLPRPLSQ